MWRLVLFRTVKVCCMMARPSMLSTRHAGRRVTRGHMTYRRKFNGLGDKASFLVSIYQNALVRIGTLIRSLAATSWIAIATLQSLNPKFALAFSNLELLNPVFFLKNNSSFSSQSSYRQQHVSSECLYKLEWFWASTTNRGWGETASENMSQASSTEAPKLTPQFCFDERLLRGS